jgi:hypothetical protein
MGFVVEWPKVKTINRLKHMAITGEFLSPFVFFAAFARQKKTPCQPPLCGNLFGNQSGSPARGAVRTAGPTFEEMSSIVPSGDQ